MLLNGIISENNEYLNNLNILIIDKICTINKIKNKNINILILDNCFIRDDGSIYVNNNIIYLDEIFILKKVKYLIITNKLRFENDSLKDKLINTLNYYKIKYLFI